MFTQVASPGSPTDAADLNLMIHREVEGLATIKTKNIFCCPPIPRDLSALAKMIILENIMRANHDQRHFIVLATDVKNYNIYWATKEVKPEIMQALIKEYSDRVFIEKSPWTGYVIYKNMGAKIIGLCAFKPRYSIKEDRPWEAFYKAAAAEGGAGAASVEMEIDNFIISKEIEHYEEAVVIMLVAAQKFIELGYAIKGDRISRLIVRVIDPAEGEELGDVKKILEIRERALQKIFGLPLGMFISRDPRNCSGYVEFVYGCEVSQIQETVYKWFGIDGDPGALEAESDEEKFCG